MTLQNFYANLAYNQKQGNNLCFHADCSFCPIRREDGYCKEDPESRLLQHLALYQQQHKLSLPEFFRLVQNNVRLKCAHLCQGISCNLCPYAHECEGKHEKDDFVFDKLTQYEQEQSPQVLTMEEFFSAIRSNLPYHDKVNILICQKVQCRYCPLAINCKIHKKSILEINEFILTSMYEFHQKMTPVQDKDKMKGILKFIQDYCTINLRYRQQSSHKIDMEFSINQDLITEAEFIAKLKHIIT